MSMLALADTGKYITEGCLNVFLLVYVGTGRHSVTNYYFIVNLAPWLAVRACSLSSPGGDSSYS